MTTATPRLRQPAVAGRFYDDDPRRCADEAKRCCTPVDEATLPAVLHGALVPHAGWVFSGRVAGRAIATLARRTRANTVVLTGSVHWAAIEGPALDPSDAWLTPLGRVPIDIELRRAILSLADFDSSEPAHAPEHSLEVEVPLLQTAFGSRLSIVPCLVPPRSQAVVWGAALGRVLRDWSPPVVVVASSDLTHYGPMYGFTPGGTGEAGHAWAIENDRHALDLVADMNAEAIVDHAQAHHNLCGAGAVAATVAACRELGAERAVVLDHTDSSREMPAPRRSEASDFVGYAGAVFGAG